MQYLTNQSKKHIVYQKVYKIINVDNVRRIGHIMFMILDFIFKSGVWVIIGMWAFININTFFIIYVHKPAVIQFEFSVIQSSDTQLK